MAKRKKLKKRAYGCLAVPFVILAVLVMIAFSMFDKTPKMLEIKTIPEEYIPIYKAAAAKYGIEWELLAAHHRVETKFSKMEPMISPVGAEGPMQFMPCTFVGWQHPTCGGLGEGNIPEEEKTDPAVIEKYGGYGVDANGDGKADPFNIEDSVFSAAHYLSENGAADGEVEKAVFTYNQSEQYVDDILYYVKEYKSQDK